MTIGHWGEGYVIKNVDDTDYTEDGRSFGPYWSGPRGFSYAPFIYATLTDAKRTITRNAWMKSRNLVITPVRFVIEEFPEGGTV